MSRPKRLDDGALAEPLAALPAGTRDGDAIRRELKFANFRDAFACMTRIAIEAECLDHHPEWSNVYATLKVRLTTHDAGGLTELDLKLAAAIDAAAARFGVAPE